MGWLFDCFKCKQRRPTSSSINLTASCKNGRRVSSTAGLLSADSAQAKESIEVERIISVQGEDLKRNLSACIKPDRKSCSARRPSSEQLLQVEKLEEEIDSLNKKLLEEAIQATSLTNEVRHLRNCSALLDSPNTFRKALNALEQALEKGNVEESQPLLYLQSLLAKIEPSEEVIETTSDEERRAKYIFECIDVSSLATKKDPKSSEKVHEKTKQVEPDQSQGNVFTPVTIAREPDEGQRVMPNYEQSTCNSRQQHLSDVVDTDSKKTQLVSVVKRRSSTTLSFSGFLLVENVTEERPISDKAAVEKFSSTEISITKIIEKTDFSCENLLEASQSLFAFSTDSSQGDSTSTAQAPFGNISKDFSFSTSDSEAGSCSEKLKGDQSFCNLQYRSPGYLWSPQDDNTRELDRVRCSLSTEQCQIDANETSHNGFSDPDTLSLSSTFCSNSMDQFSSSSLESEQNVSSHSTVQALGMSQPEESMDRAICLCQKFAASVHPVKDCILHEAGSEVKHRFKSSVLEGQMRTINMENTNLDEAVFFENLMHSSFDEAALKVLDRSASSEEVSLSRTSHTTSPCLSQGEFSIVGSEAIVELSSPGTTSIWSPDTPTSPFNVHNFSPLRPVTGIKEGCPSDFLSETPSTPVSVNSHESRLHLAKADVSKPKFSPFRTPLASLTQAETPSTIHSQGSSSSLGEDRPILGTVAAHWNHSSTSSTRKWWDGKGIPNSTNKYKEDQKVSWHATPFEVRLERALAKQGRVFQKKLFTGAMATEMEVGM